MRIPEAEVLYPRMPSPRSDAVRLPAGAACMHTRIHACISVVGARVGNPPCMALLLQGLFSSTAHPTFSSWPASGPAKQQPARSHT